MIEQWCHSVYYRDGITYSKNFIYWNIQFSPCSKQFAFDSVSTALLYHNLNIKNRLNEK